MKKLFTALSLFLVLLLGGCTLFAQPTEPVTYTVQYTVQGTVYYEQIIEEGQLPEAIEIIQPQGLQIVCWLYNGVETDPASVPVTQDLCYEALAYPVLSNHAPYLFADSEGYLQPDEPLTADALLQALEALAAEGARTYFPEIPTGSQSVTCRDVTAVLENFYDTEAVSAAFTGEAEAAMSRTAFAQSMNILLGRDVDSPFILAASAQIPMDITQDRTDTADLLEAALRHTPDETGITWADVELPVTYEPGFVNIDGWLYYVQENQRFLRDGYVGALYFGADGRYTCADAELDATVARILSELIAQDPEADRLTLLRSAYDHCHSQYVYLRKEAYSFGQTGWEIEDAKEMFSSGRGNCYNYAAIFWSLARGLGYEARAVSGTCTGTDQPHGWVIINLDGADYFFDPEWQYAYHERGVYDKDMFMIPMDRISYWTYKWTE